ncbi:hypothetical protein FJT64_025986 [Amphibalanus amphitrite]|uniref:Uncharacterized protein n=1 Tax=Amphibalanus amphitrite TaxID=1232801 RepID=A0A6A4W9F4_AMPAM|nr:hypothetical protein FJT64_025986 [Amphibalanus amphitrite]
MRMSEDGQAFSWFTMANKTLGTYGAALVLVTKTIQEAVTYFVQHLRHLIVTELPKNGFDVFGRRAPNSNAAFAGPAAAAGAIVGRSGRPTQRAQRTWACQPDLGGHLGARAGSLLGRRDGSAVASGCTGPSRCTGRPRCRESAADPDTETSSADVQEALLESFQSAADQMSEDGQAFSWFTMANKTLGTYGAALVVVTKNVQEALTYFVQHLRHLIVTELPKNADSQRLLAAARTSTAVLDRALKAAADAVGGVPPHVVARFKNSMNRAFHNIQARYDVFGRRAPVSNGAFAGPAAAAGAVVGCTGRPAQRAQRTWACQPDLGAHLGARAGSLLGRRDGSAVASGCTGPSRCTGRPRCRGATASARGPGGGHQGGHRLIRVVEAVQSHYRRTRRTQFGLDDKETYRPLSRPLILPGRELREAGKFHHDPQTGAEVRTHSLARSERDYSAYGRRKRITGFVADLRQAFMDSLSLSDGPVLVKEQATGVLVSPWDPSTIKCAGSLAWLQARSTGRSGGSPIKATQAVPNQNFLG